jgi:membrane-associated phospholipid phosphatase
MLGQAKPWFLTSGSQFRPAPPPAYLSPAFNTDLAEVLTVRTNLTPPQLAIALGWAYPTGTYTPVGFWNELAATYVAADGLDEAAAARVFGLMSAAVFDSFIAGFEAKYYYWTIRPHQANPAITTAFAVPNYPAYPSGHGSVSGASARVLAHFFPGRAAELNALRDEAAMSRIYAGIHYRFDMTAARSMSEAVADWVIAQGL